MCRQTATRIKLHNEENLKSTLSKNGAKQTILPLETVKKAVFLRFSYPSAT